MKKAKETSTDPTLADVYQIQYNQIRLNDEPTFRRDLVGKLAEFGKTASAKYKGIQQNYPFLLKLYPAIETSHRHIFFLSVDKFFLGNTTLIEPGYKFVGNSITKGALIFIDEIDSTKETILRQQISESQEQKVDIVKLFCQINNSLANKTIPANFFNQNPGKEPDHTSRSAYEKIKKVFASTSQKYKLDRVFKYQGKEEDQSFLFDDFSLMTISSGEHDKAIDVEEDDQKTTNILAVHEAEDKDKGNSFYPVINSINGAITYFVNGIAMIARNYMEWRNAIRKDASDDRMELDAAITTVLECFDLDPKFVELLTRMILSHVNGFREFDDKHIFADSVYDTGFRFYSFSDDIRQDLSTRINMVYLLSTPESYLAGLADRSLVVGLSATGNIPTVTGNYDLGYLKDKLGDKFYTIDPESKQRLAKSFSDKEQGNHKTRVFSLSAKIQDGHILTAEPLFQSVEREKKVAEEIQTKEQHSINVERFLKIVLAIKSFLFDPKSKVLLVLTNRNVKTDDSDLFSVDNYKKIITELMDDKKVAVRYEIYPLYGSRFEEQKDRYLASAKSGVKIILMTSYPASGTGQNLQYEVEDETTGEKKKKDIDSVYLEYPRNMIVNSMRGLTDSDLIKYIFQVEALGETGDISCSLSKELIRYAFKKTMGLKAFERNVHALYSTSSVNNHAVKCLVQGVGRVCRVGAKTLDTHIFLDEEIVGKLDFSCLKGVLLNSEFKEILLTVRQEQDAVLKNEVNRCHLNQGLWNNRFCLSTINHYLSDNHESWSGKDMKSWQELREFVLTHPTISDEELAQYPYYKKLYIHAPEGAKTNRYFLGIKDGSHIDSFSYSHGPEHSLMISDDRSPLNVLMANADIAAFFEQKGYAKSFVASDNVILPVIFTNIYKGALGEAVGRYLFEKAGILLNDITDGFKFERFDYCLAQDPDIYVDFKLWKQFVDDSDASEMSNKRKSQGTAEKLKIIQGKKALVVNILAEGEDHPKVKGEGNILIVPSLLEDNGNVPSIHSGNFAKILSFLEEEPQK